MRWPLCLPAGSVQSSLLPLGSFWTLRKLFCCSPAHDGACGKCVGFSNSAVQSAYHSLFISQRNDRILLLPRLYLEKRQFPSPSRISLVLLLAAFPSHPPPSIYGDAQARRGRGTGCRDKLKFSTSLLPSNSSLFSKSRAF